MGTVAERLGYVTFNFHKDELFIRSMMFPYGPKESRCVNVTNNLYMGFLKIGDD